LKNMLWRTGPAIIFSPFCGGGGAGETVLFSAPNQTSRFMPAETGEIQPTGYVYLLGAETAVGRPTHRRSGEKHLQHFLCWPSTAWCKKKKNWLETTSDWLYFWCLCSLPLHFVYLFVSVLQKHSHCFP